MERWSTDDLQTHKLCLSLGTVAFVCLLNLGCGGESGGATISGTVVSNGTPIPDGRVVFSSDEANCSGEISDGKYELKNKGKSNVPLGEYIVTVFPPDMVVYNPDTGEDEKIEGDVDLKLFPAKYQRKDKSDIKFSPEAGDNNFDIILKKSWCISGESS